MATGALRLTRFLVALRATSASDTNKAFWAFAIFARAFRRSTLKLRNTDATDTIGTLWAHIIGSTSREAMITETSESRRA